MGTMSAIKDDTCEIIYDILRNRLSLPEEECTYELAIDIFDAVVEHATTLNDESAKALKIYEESMNGDLSLLRDLHDDTPEDKYLLGYFNGVHGCKMALHTVKVLTGLIERG